MEEQKDLDDLKKLMAEQQAKLASTMAEMEIKATTLQEKLDKKSELSKSNAKAGVKKVALEYKIVELEVKWPKPPPYTFGKPDPAKQYTFGKPDPAKQFPGASSTNPELFTHPTSKKSEAEKAWAKDIKSEYCKQLLKFETTTLKELGEDGWTLRSVLEVCLEEFMTGSTYMYHFSRPL